MQRVSVTNSDGFNSILITKLENTEKNEASFRRNGLNIFLQLYHANMKQRMILTQLNKIWSKKKGEQRWTIRNMKDFCCSKQIGKYFRLSFKSFLQDESVITWIENSPRKEENKLRYRNLIQVISGELDVKFPFYLFSTTQVRKIEATQETNVKISTQQQEKQSYSQQLKRLPKQTVIQEQEIQSMSQRMNNNDDYEEQYIDSNMSQKFF